MIGFTERRNLDGRNGPVGGGSAEHGNGVGDVVQLALDVDHRPLEADELFADRRKLFEHLRFDEVKVVLNGSRLLLQAVRVICTCEIGTKLVQTPYIIMEYV